MERRTAPRCWMRTAVRRRRSVLGAAEAAVLQEVGRDPARLRIALTVTPWIEGPVDPECAEAARRRQLCQPRHHIEEARPQIDEAAWLQRRSQSSRPA